MADDNIAWHCRREAQAQIDAGIGDGWPLTQAAATIEAQQAEIERLRGEVERLTALHVRIASQSDVAAAYQQVYFEDFPVVKAAQAETLLCRERLDAERALADQLAEALRVVAHDRPSAHTDDVWTKVLAACAAYQEARRG